METRPLKFYLIVKGKSNKVKVWFSEHKEEIKSEALRFLCYAVGFGVGYFVGTKLNDLRIDNGLSRMHADSLVKFFDPAAGIEVDLSKVGKVIRKT